MKHAEQPVLLSLTDNGLALSTEQKHAYLHLLARGASPAGACMQLGISLACIASTMEADPQFQSLVDQIQELLSQNVAAALYRQAIEGSVSAQQFYLKNRPPPEWPDPVVGSAHSPFDSLTDEELLARFREATADFLSANAPRLEPPHGPPGSADLP